MTKTSSTQHQWALLIMFTWKYSEPSISCGIYSQKYSEKTPIARPYGRAMGVLSEFIVWNFFYHFYLFSISGVFNILLYSTTVYWESIVYCQCAMTKKNYSYKSTCTSIDRSILSMRHLLSEEFNSYPESSSSQTLCQEQVAFFTIYWVIADHNTFLNTSNIAQSHISVKLQHYCPVNCSWWYMSPFTILVKSMHFTWRSSVRTQNSQ